MQCVMKYMTRSYMLNIDTYRFVVAAEEVFQCTPRLFQSSVPATNGRVDAVMDCTAAKHQTG